MSEGWQAYQWGEYDRAIASFETAAAKSPPNSEEQAKAYFGVATAYWQRRPEPDFELARNYFEMVRSIAPNSDLAPWSLLCMARIDAAPRVAEVPQVTQAHRDQAIASYQRVIDAYPEHDAGQEAFVLQQSLRLASLESNDIETSVARFNEFLKKYPSSKYESHVWAALQHAYELQGDSEKRLHAMIKAYETLDVDKTNPALIKPWIFWHIATVAEFEVGDFDTARKYHQLLAEKFPRDSLLFSSQLALERMSKKEAEILQQLGAAGDSGNVRTP